MKIIVKLLFIALVISNSLYANTHAGKHKKLPLAISLPYLKTIQPYAIELGSGPMDIHVFVDPKCPRSQEFMTLVSQSEKMQRLYHYHFYLYELKRFKSHPLITSIYSSKDRLKAMQAVMIKKTTIPTLEVNKKVRQIMKAIEKVGEALDVYKRPYLVLVRKGKQ